MRRKSRVLELVLVVVGVAGLGAFMRPPAADPLRQAVQGGLVSTRAGWQSSGRPLAFNPDTLSVCGIRPTMRAREVKAILGPPSSRRDGVWKYAARKLEITFGYFFENDMVYMVRGVQMESGGEVIVRAGDPLAVRKEKLCKVGWSTGQGVNFDEGYKARLHSNGELTLVLIPELCGTASAQTRGSHKMVDYRTYVGAQEAAGRGRSGMQR